MAAAATTATTHSGANRSVDNSIYSNISSGDLREIQDIDIDGSFGTKIDTLARHLIWLRQHDPGAQAVVFSQYRPFLEILGRAFGRYNIRYTSSLGDHAKAIERFKQDHSVSNYHLSISEKELLMGLCTCRLNVFFSMLNHIRLA